jgi:cytidine deaminase
LIGDSHGQRGQEWRATAEELIAIDEKETGTEYGQNVRDTFPMADVFVSYSGLPELEKTIDRFIDIFFGRPFMTPTREEYGMFHAQAAALRSAALGRQVGAAIATAEGDILAVGVNEVPKAHGGHYWHEDEGDARDFARGQDQNDRVKRVLLRDLLGEMARRKWLAESAGRTIESLVDELIVGSAASRPFKDSFIMGLTEFGRDVHAEMSALLSAARLGVSIRGCRLFTTTFPCHNCAKHIVSAGISEVTYIEPYAKSFAREFHPDSINVDGDSTGQIPFAPFVGVAPRRYLEWFKAGTRKDERGRPTNWRPGEAVPLFAHPALGGYDVTYPDREHQILSQIESGMRSAGLLEASAGASHGANAGEPRG